MITSPLELKRYLTEPDLRFDTVPLLDLCLIGLFLAFQSSRFIASPGITLDIPDVDKGSVERNPDECGGDGIDRARE